MTHDEQSFIPMLAVQASPTVPPRVDYLAGSTILKSGESLGYRSLCLNLLSFIFLTYEIMNMGIVFLTIVLGLIYNKGNKHYIVT